MQFYVIMTQRDFSMSSSRSFDDDRITRRDRFCSLSPLTNTAPIALEVIFCTSTTVIAGSCSGVLVLSFWSCASVSIHHDFPIKHDRRTTIFLFIFEREIHPLSLNGLSHGLCAMFCSYLQYWF